MQLEGLDRPCAPLHASVHGLLHVPSNPIDKALYQHEGQLTMSQMRKRNKTQ